jgi:hypothetical protein
MGCSLRPPHIHTLPHPLPKLYNQLLLRSRSIPYHTYEQNLHWHNPHSLRWKHWEVCCFSSYLAHETDRFGYKDNSE